MNDDSISRQAAIALADSLKNNLPDDERTADCVIAHNEGILEYQTALSLLPTAKPSNKVFEEIVVEYPDPDTCAYQEYKGKPYFLIRYLEDEQYLGFGTYNPEVLSQYLKEYFVHPVEPKAGEWKHRKNWSMYVCDQCSFENHEASKYCPNCGARMEESDG